MGGLRLTKRRALLQASSVGLAATARRRLTVTTHTPGATSRPSVSEAPASVPQATPPLSSRDARCARSVSFYVPSIHAITDALS